MFIQSTSVFQCYLLTTFSKPINLTLTIIITKCGCNIQNNNSIVKSVKHPVQPQVFTNLYEIVEC